MVTIRLSGPARARQQSDDGDSVLITDPFRLASLAGLEYRARDSCISDVLIDDGQAKSLMGAGVVGGFIRIDYDPDRGGLLIVTEYSAPRRLNGSELKLLVDFTCSQWDEGVGDNFGQSFATATSVYFTSMAYPESVRVDQEDVV